MHLTTKIYTQELHSARETDDWPMLKLELVDACGGEYLVLTATKWAIDGRDEVDRLAGEMKALMATAKRYEE